MDHLYVGGQIRQVGQIWTENRENADFCWLFVIVMA
jgi:hypothetical protein